MHPGMFRFHQLGEPREIREELLCCCLHVHDPRHGFRRLRLRLKMHYDKARSASVGEVLTFDQGRFAARRGNHRNVVSRPDRVESKSTSRMGDMLWRLPIAKEY